MLLTEQFFPGKKTANKKSSDVGINNDSTFKVDEENEKNIITKNSSSILVM